MGGGAIATPNLNPRVAAAFPEVANFAIDKPENTRTSVEQLHASGIAFERKIHAKFKFLEAKVFHLCVQRLQTPQFQRLHVVITKLTLDKDHKALNGRKHLRERVQRLQTRQQ